MFIITGGGSGIGRALALALAQREQTVLIIGRRELPLQETAAMSPFIEFLCADVSTSNGLDAIKNHIQSYSQVKALINNAGTIHPVAPLSEVSLDEWQHTLNTNLNAALFLPQKIQDQLTNSRVLNIGSGAAYFPIKGWGAYCVSKAALAMLTRCCQLEFTTTAFASVMPGITDTDMQVIARTGVNMDAEHTEFYRKLKQHQRLIAPETVAEFLVWLLLDVDPETYSSQEWDIYDTQHHALWLREPHHVLHWDF